MEKLSVLRAAIDNSQLQHFLKALPHLSEVPKTDLLTKVASRINVNPDLLSMLCGYILSK